MRIPFHRSYFTGNELKYLQELLESGDVSSDGAFTERCKRLFSAMGFGFTEFTPSCTAGLEMAALIADIGPGDEVIVPSFTFVTSVSAFVRSGAKPVYIDVRADTGNLDETKLASLLTDRTKAIVPVHYAGVGCDMDQINAIAAEREITVIEDAAQALGGQYKSRPLGSLGSMSVFSFHSTKNFTSGEGGALVVNDPALVEKAKIVRDKGTNRSQFIEGLVDKYTWVDLGSSFVASELQTAFLCAQLEAVHEITEKRRSLYEAYRSGLAGLEARGRITLPAISDDCTSNYHLFHVLLNSNEERDRAIEFLAAEEIQSSFHFVPLHLSPYGQRFWNCESDLSVTEDIAGRLLRLPLYPSMELAEVHRVCDAFAHCVE